ncbi:MAG: hypothetical protein IJC38_01100 [Erysipelotrichaceae bacterium]|nr:hypothetical protein [Erysipelotrichaceae bacterium]
MFQVFNKGALTRNQRFARAVVFGTLASLGLCLVYGLISSSMRIEFSYAFVLMGYLIGLAIQKMGRGVQVQFSILGAVLAALTFVFADLIAWYGFSVFTSLDFLIFGLRSWLNVMMNFTAGGVSGLLSLLFRGFGVIVAYQNSRIV